MPRKAVSKKQWRLFKAAEQGDVTLPGLSPKEAGEMISGQSPRGLPERAAKRGLDRLVKRVKRVKGERFRVR